MNTKEIEIHIHSRDGEAPRLVSISEDATIEELLQKLSPGNHTDLYLIVGDEDHPHDKRRKLSECGVKHQHHVHCHPRTLHYTVDAEPQKTTQHKLTAEEIMKNAGVDPKNHYLILLAGKGQESFKDHPNKPIHMHDCMQFITASLCPTTVS
jgi:hypothetical protein